jgi:dephospho-CoA kinase
MAFEYAIALTGGIASGKSTVCNLLKLYGLRVIDADAVAHAVLQREADAVAALFGDGVRDASGGIDRKALGRLVFGDAEARKRLEALLHPLIRREIEQESARHDRLKGPYIIDIPLFYETGAYPIDRVVVVYAPRELQKKRLMEREGLSESEAEARLDAQMDIEIKRRQATWVVRNDGNLKDLQRETERIFYEITQSRHFN